MIAPRNPEVLRLLCVSNFPEKMKGANDRALYFRSALIRGSVRFWLRANS
jgi:CRISPR/Cas system CMR-associated protein Cmr1 (group 7 of RAMP superfamily)